MAAFGKKIISVFISLIIVFSSMGMAFAQSEQAPLLDTPESIEETDAEMPAEPSAEPSIEPEPSAEPSETQAPQEPEPMSSEEPEATQTTEAPEDTQTPEEQEDGLSEAVVFEIKELARTDGTGAAAMLNAYKAESGFDAVVADVLVSYAGSQNALQYDAFIKAVDIGGIGISASVDAGIDAVSIETFGGVLSGQDGSYSLTYPMEISAEAEAAFAAYLGNGNATVRTGFSFVLPEGAATADVYDSMAAEPASGIFNMENSVPLILSGQAGLYMDIAQPDGEGIAMLPVPEGTAKTWAVVFRDANGNTVSAGKVILSVQTTSDLREEVLEEENIDTDLPYVEDEILVVFKDGVSESQEEITIQSFGEETQDENDVSVVELDEDKTVEQAVDEMNDNPNVEIAQPNYIYTLMEGDLEAMTTTIDDPYAVNQWYLDSIGMQDAWDYSKTSGAVKVAVLDTGVDLNHPDLADNIVYSWDAVGGAALTGDLGYHGTHVAGIVAAEANNSVGIAGVSYNAGIIAINVFYDDATYGLLTNSYYLCEGYDIAMAQGARVVNMSLGGYFGTGGPGEYDLLLEEKIDEAAAQDIVTVCAGGNGDSSGNPITEPTFPGDYDTCISVVPIDSSDVRASYADYNSYKDISAPGVSIYSTMPSAYGSYASLGGSSMAAPVVSGVVAAMIAADPGLTVAEVKTLLYENADDLGDAGYDSYYGLGKSGRARYYTGFGWFFHRDF